MATNGISQNTLPIDEITVQERQVTVKVLTIGTKQITQALFKQLLNESIIDPSTGDLLGIPWGRVNYHVGCEGIHGTHFHVVWQKDQELRRAIVGMPWTWREGDSLMSCAYDKLERNFRHAANVFVDARILEGWKPQKLDDIAVKVEGESIEVWLDNDEKNYWCTWEPTQKKSKEYLESYIARDGYDTGQSKTIYQDMLIPAALTFKRFKQTWAQSCSTLWQLDQLFIAVSGVWK